MTFDAYIQLLGIKPDAVYSFQQAAQKLDKEPRTIESWTRVGMKTKKHGVVVLERFCVGREPRVSGHDLIEFLRKTQRTC